MLAYFSADGINYHPQYVKVVNKEPLMSNKSQNISLSLAQRIGRFVKLELYFDNKWLLISEVNFRSQSTSKDIGFNALLHQPEDSLGEDLNDNIKDVEMDSQRDNEVLSDTPGQPESASPNDAISPNSANGKSNLKAKEANQVSSSGFKLIRLVREQNVSDCVKKLAAFRGSLS